MNLLVLASVMFLLEYFVLLRVYQRSPELQRISLVVAPLMAVASYCIGKAVLKREPKPAEIFLIVMALELPLSLRGYTLVPDAAVWERLLVAGSFGTVAYTIAQKAV